MRIKLFVSGGTVNTWRVEEQVWLDLYNTGLIFVGSPKTSDDGELFFRFAKNALPGQGRDSMEKVDP